MEQMTLTKAMQKYLTLPGETLKVSDIAKLTKEDREDLKAAFLAIGIDTNSPLTVVAKLGS